MLKITYLLWLFGLALLSLNLAAQTNCDNVSQIPTAECDALLALYDSTNGEGWTDNIKWLTNNKPCGWFGVMCVNGHVAYLALADNRLSGPLPTGLDALSELKGFELHTNQLNGTIPPDLGNLAKLESFYLYSNQLSGAIPPKLGDLTNLNYLRLHENDLCGDIPVELMNLTNILGLSLDNNHLTASDPDLIVWLDYYNPGWETTQTPCSEFDTLQFASAAYSVNEDGISVEIIVKRVNANDGAVSVDCISSDGTAMAGEDYIAVTETLNWADQDNRDKVCTVPILDDDDFEDDKTFYLTLFNPTGGAAIGSPDTAVVTIIDGEKPSTGTLQFSKAEYSADENGGSVEITVTRSDGSYGEASVKVVTGNGTAKKGKDFEKTIVILNWDDGEAGDKTFTVSIIDDDEIEGDETFKLKLKNAKGAFLGNPTKAEATIVDNDAPTLQFSKDKYEVNEDAETVAVTVTISGVPNNTVVVECSTSDGSATESDDYFPKSNTLTWGALDGNGKVITVDIIDDSDFEGDETFNLTLYNPFGATIGSPDTTEVTIVDNESTKPGTLQFSEAMYDVNETDGAVTITITRVGGSSGAASVKAVTGNGTAKKGKDFEKTTKTLKWDDGEAGDKTFTVDIFDDSEIEGDETFKLKLKKAKGAELGNPKKAEVTIVDDDDELSSICNEVTEIPTIECEALVAFYDGTNGEN
jgi:hypothetical protein